MLMVKESNVRSNGVCLVIVLYFYSKKLYSYYFLKLNSKPTFALFSIHFFCLAIVFKAICILFFTYN